MSSEGALILVVGPSGAGKDAILREARRSFEGDDRIRFVRRFITRPPDANEDNCALTLRQFATARRLGGFFLAWDAHGLSYGIPASVGIDLARGVSVVANVSRAIVDPARAIWMRTFVVQVTASDETLRRRLERRGRDDDMDERLARARKVGPAADVEISNDDDLANAAMKMVAFVREVTDGSQVRRRSG